MTCKFFLTNRNTAADSYIAGMTHLDDKLVLDAMKIGDKLSLYREDNKFDKNAILIMNADKKKLGYVPEKDNLIFARLMDAGKLFCARITKIELKGDFYKVAIGFIWLIFERLTGLCSEKRKSRSRSPMILTYSTL